MNLSTLIEICRPGELGDWVYGEDDQQESAHPDRIEKDIVSQYELLEEDAVFSGSTGSIDNLQNQYIIKNKASGTLYKVLTAHDSWSDFMPEAFENARISEAVQENIVVTNYKSIGTTYIDNL